jgi:acyl transferase domain-containing protein
VPVDWRSYLTNVGVPGRHVDLPTYAFDRQRYWVAQARGQGDVTGAGLDAIEHPFLAASTDVAAGDQLLLSGQVSLADDPWLADHTIFADVVFPGAAFLEAALHALDGAECRSIEELTLHAPLTLVDGAVQLTLDWTPLPGATGSGRPVPEVEFTHAPASGDGDGEDVPASARARAHEVLRLVQTWLRDERFGDTRRAITPTDSRDR